MKRTMSIQFDDSIVHHVLEQSNLAAMSLSVNPSPCKVTICALQTCERLHGCRDDWGTPQKKKKNIKKIIKKKNNNNKKLNTPKTH